MAPVLTKIYCRAPDFNNEMRGVVYRFREEKIGVIADIEGMFNAFVVPPSDRDFLRFYWYRDNNPSSEFVQYCGKTHLFGCTSSPAVANFCLRYSTQSTQAEKFPEARAFINNNFYVDDGLISVATADEAVKLISDSRQILSKYNINLHKILSNSVDVLKAFPSSDTAESYEIFGSKETFSHRTLGILWNPKEDSFEMHANPPNRPFTRRGVVSVINSLYDPLSIAAPVSLAGKLLQRQALLPRKCSKSEVVNFGWDDELPSQFLESWETGRPVCPPE